MQPLFQTLVKDQQVIEIILSDYSKFKKKEKKFILFEFSTSASICT